VSLLGKSALCRVPGRMALGKDFVKKFKNPYLPSARPGGTRQRIKKTLPSVRSGALGKGGFNLPAQPAHTHHTHAPASALACASAAPARARARPRQRRPSPHTSSGLIL